MRALLTGTLLLACLSGCLDDGAPANTEGNDDPTATSVEPFHVDATYDVFPNGMDETWEWTMSADMAGHVRVERTADPASTSGSSPGPICYRIGWPEGHQQGGGPDCNPSSVGNVNLAIAPTSQVGDRTIFETDLYPNDFTLHVWSTQADTIEVRVVIDTWVEEP